jgi:hypothetical protein
MKGRHGRKLHLHPPLRRQPNQAFRHYKPNPESPGTYGMDSGYGDPPGAEVGPNPEVGRQPDGSSYNGGGSGATGVTAEMLAQAVDKRFFRSD